MAQMHRISGTATKVYDEGGITYVRYHNTDVVAFNDKFVTLRTGGWQSNTTKTRMTQASNQLDLGYSVRQKDFGWFVKTKAGEYPFDSENFTFNRKTGKKSSKHLPEGTGGARGRRRNPGIDVEIHDTGSIVLFLLVSSTARSWWKDNVKGGLEFGGKKVVEHRYAGDIIESMLNEGFEVK